MDTLEETRYKVGQHVFTIIAPKVKMIIRKYYAKIYYCTFSDHPEKKELALFEREIIR